MLHSPLNGFPPLIDNVQSDYLQGLSSPQYSYPSVGLFLNAAYPSVSLFVDVANHMMYNIIPVGILNTTLPPVMRREDFTYYLVEYEIETSKRSYYSIPLLVNPVILAIYENDMKLYILTWKCSDGSIGASNYNPPIGMYPYLKTTNIPRLSCGNSTVIPYTIVFDTSNKSFFIYNYTITNPHTPPSSFVNYKNNLNTGDFKAFNSGCNNSTCLLSKRTMFNNFYYMDTGSDASYGGTLGYGSFHFSFFGDLTKEFCVSLIMDSNNGYQIYNVPFTFIIIRAYCLTGNAVSVISLNSSDIGINESILQGSNSKYAAYSILLDPSSDYLYVTLLGQVETYAAGGGYYQYSVVKVFIYYINWKGNGISLLGSISPLIKSSGYIFNTNYNNAYTFIATFLNKTNEFLFITDGVSTDPIQLQNGQVNQGQEYSHILRFSYDDLVSGKIGQIGILQNDTTLPYKFEIANLDKVNKLSYTFAPIKTTFLNNTFKLKLIPQPVTIPSFDSIPSMLTIGENGGGN